MTSLNEGKKDLLIFRRLAIKGAAALFFTLVLANALAYLFGSTKLSQLLIGSLLGSTLASCNVFILAYAMYALVFKKRLSALVWPVLFFILVSTVALLCAFLYPNIVFGFALGLSAPLLLGALIAYDSATRLTIAGNRAT